MKPIIIAEIGCNHQGSMDLAKKHIKAAADSGADYVKFQKRDNDFHRSNNPDWDKPHPNGNNAFGATYYEHRMALEFNIDEHIILQSYCQRNKIGYACSVWDVKSAEELADLTPDYIKIPSAMNTNPALLKTCLDLYDKIHISGGMTTQKELYNIMCLTKGAKEVIFYHCTSGYPVPFNELYLMEIYEQCEDGVYHMGYSGHHLGIAIDIAAYTLGARHIERHFTLDRTLKGTDHAASLEPGGLTKLVRDLRAVEQALQYKENEISPIEIPQREKLKWKP